MRTFDDYLSEARRVQNVASNNQIANLLGITKGAISALFQGKSLPTDDTMLKLAELANMDTETALLDLSIWRSAGNKKAQSTWLNLAHKLALL